jgi:hypothetical protein
MPFWCYSLRVYGFDILLLDPKFKIKKGDGAPLNFSIDSPAPPRREEEKRESLAAANIGNRLFFLFTNFCLKYNLFFGISKKSEKNFQKGDK